ncbi:MAG: hypothetical protein V2L15_05415 [Desulfobacteraceae bacterium]|jgi:hypothetical protein|nr:hypothetical protein [Desulfobacteraceae bacterium]
MPFFSPDPTPGAAPVFEKQLFDFAMAGCPWRYTGTCAATRHACTADTCAVWHGLKELMRCTQPPHCPK